ncbi:3-ketoacyl-CoA thiolase [Polystyrenella longa]|uniref:acetyl-CoA C-acyltransferase n=1 Tax=Polystyrenella longa TaxID=2528007 RepID=A0A518CLI7_9PLAN|nr:acetyl-CoA C-acyltransferase [Polystyrenella longa]QDU80092.1 3-ketoacyl-CoA thiolase [Polystyrenella longa]
MKQAVVIDAVRTPVAKASPDKGNFRDVRAEDLSAHAIKSLVERSGIDPHLVEDVKWGCVQQQGEQGYDVGRIASLIAGLPIEVAGVTVNRNCGSSLTALNDAAMYIAAANDDIQIVGGVEHMHHVPMDKGYSVAPSLLYKYSEAMMNMGVTAEYLSMKYQVGRVEQDEFSARSHQLAAEATKGGHYESEIVPTWGRNDEGHKILIKQDQGIRYDCNIEGLASLKPIFNPAGGSVTAGNSSQLSVGAVAMLMMSEYRATELGYKPMAKVIANAVVGVDPCEMGIGPVPAVNKALERAGLTIDQIGAIELNEAFAVQALSVLKSLGIGVDTVNLRGGAIALGHPLGASGARIATTLLHRMRDENVRYGIATMCIGQGQGIATIFESCMV